MAVGISCLACFLPKAVMNCLEIASLDPNFSHSLHEAAALQPGQQLVPLLCFTASFYYFK